MTFLEHVQMCREVAERLLASSISEEDAVKAIVRLDRELDPPPIKAAPGTWIDVVNRTRNPTPADLEVRRLRRILFERELAEFGNQERSH